jgi:hypothetical protein
MNATAIQPAEVTCLLAAAVGRSERCLRTLCPYWDSVEGGARTNGCQFGRSAPYLTMQPAFARQLLALRAHFEDLRGP